MYLFCFDLRGASGASPFCLVFLRPRIVLGACVETPLRLEYDLICVKANMIAAFKQLGNCPMWACGIPLSGWGRQVGTPCVVPIWGAPTLQHERSDQLKHSSTTKATELKIRAPAPFCKTLRKSWYSQHVPRAEHRAGATSTEPFIPPEPHSAITVLLMIVVRNYSYF